MKQEVVRGHNKNDKSNADQWSLDDVIDVTNTTNMERAEHVRSAPPEGVYVHGLSLDGAAWSKQEQTIVESEPKKLFTPLVVLFITANAKKLQDKVVLQSFGPEGPYRCPVYKYPVRTGRFFVFLVTLKCPNGKAPAHWILRGVALLCNT